VVITRVVIVGGGQAGCETAAALRGRGFEGSVTVIGDEPDEPYQRPPLSKDFLIDTKPAVIALRGPGFYLDNRIELRRGDRAAEVDCARRQVRSESGACIPYDHLVLATGARNRLLPVPGAALSGVHYLRTSADARAVRASLERSSGLVVVGAGFIGLEVAAAAAMRGVPVTIVEASDRPMVRTSSLPVSTFFADGHRRNGVRLLLGAGVEEVVSAGSQVVGVRTGDGELVRADMVLVGIGVLPNVDIAARCGLAVDDGIVVDEQLLTADRGISAVGDCASYPSGIGDARHRLESVQNAIDHARMVAARLSGGRTEPGVPWFWSHQFGHKLQIAGVAPDRSRTAVRGRPSAGQFSVFSFDSTDRLRAVESVNQAAEHMAARRALKAGLPISPEQAADPDFDFIAASRNAATSVPDAGRSGRVLQAGI